MYHYVISEHEVVEFFLTLPKLTQTPCAPSQKLVKEGCRIYFDLFWYIKL